jgi:hypothetical protein
MPGDIPALLSIFSQSDAEHSENANSVQENVCCRWAPTNPDLARNIPKNSGRTRDAWSDQWERFATISSELEASRY